MTFFALLLLAAIFAPSATLLPAGEAIVEGREVTIGDVARVEGVPAAERARLEARVIARLSAGGTVTLSRTVLAALVRRAVPVLSPAPGEGEVILRTSQPAAATGKRPVRCWSLAVPVRGGAALDAGDAEPADCESGRAAAAIAFDRRDGVVRAVKDLPANAYLGAVFLDRGLSVERGAELTLVSEVGPVRIDRRVTAVQPGRVGEALFVRDEEGEIFSLPLVRVEEAEVEP